MKKFRCAFLSKGAVYQRYPPKKTLIEVHDTGYRWRTTQLDIGVYFACCTKNESNTIIHIRKFSNLGERKITCVLRMILLMIQRSISMPKLKSSEPWRHPACCRLHPAIWRERLDMFSAHSLSAQQEITNL